MEACMTLDKVQYEEIPHTGDLAIKVVASGAEELAASCVLSLTKLLVDDSDVKGNVRRSLEAAAEGWEERLVILMQDYLYLAVTEGFLAASAVLKREEGSDMVRLELSGEPHDPTRHEPFREIKAVTYHNIFFGPKESGRWEASIVLDI